MFTQSITHINNDDTSHSQSEHVNVGRSHRYAEIKCNRQLSVHNSSETMIILFVNAYFQFKVPILSYDPDPHFLKKKFSIHARKRTISRVRVSTGYVFP